jgi:GntR family transcriptional regulator, transcriptional repressor for pyruvate dehydrogenase complex
MTTNANSSRPPEPIARGTVVDDVIERITNLILEEGLRPGDQLFTERDLMARLVVGRSSLREAIKTLCALGILEIKHGTGTFISSGSTSMLTRPLKWGLFLSGTSVKEILDARSVIEVALARWAAERASDDEIANIAAVLRELEKVQENHAQYVEYDLQFHMAIAKASHNEMLTTVLVTMQHILRTWMEATFLESRSTRHSMEMHTQILAAIAAHDAEAAGKAMFIHTSGGPLLTVAEQRYPGTMMPLSAFNMSLSRGR